jgi:hypothetical protein
MTEITRVAIDTFKSVFTLHATDAQGRAVLRRNLAAPGSGGVFCQIAAGRGGDGGMAGHTIAFAPDQIFSASPLATTGPSTHGLRIAVCGFWRKNP